MSARIKILTAAVLCSSALFVVPANAQQLVSQDRLDNADAEPQNWLHPLQNYGSQRYSRLDEINRDTIDDLHVAFTLPLMHCLRGRNTLSNRAMPLVDTNIMWFEGCSGMLYKIDMTAGNQAIVEWTVDLGDEDAGTSGTTRGTAMYMDSIIMNVRAGGDLEARIARVNRDTGELIYDLVRAGEEVMNGPWPGGDQHSGIEPNSENFTSGPMVMEGIIVNGNGSGDAGTRGWLQGIDFVTGEIPLALVCCSWPRPVRPRDLGRRGRGLMADRRRRGLDTRLLRYRPKPLHPGFGAAGADVRSGVPSG